MLDYTQLGQFEIYCKVCGNSDIAIDYTDHTYHCRNCGNSTLPKTTREEDLITFAKCMTTKDFMTYAYTSDVIRGRANYIYIGNNESSVYITKNPVSGYDYYYVYMQRDDNTRHFIKGATGEDLSYHTLNSVIAFGDRFVSTNLLYKACNVKSAILRNRLDYSRVE